MCRECIPAPQRKEIINKGEILKYGSQRYT